MTHPACYPVCHLAASRIHLSSLLAPPASHLCVVNMFSGHNALNMPLHSQTNHKTSRDRQARAVLSYLTFQQDINFLNSKSAPIVKYTWCLLCLMGADCVCCNQSLVTIVTRGRRGTLSPHLDTALGCTHSCPPIRAQHLMQ